jgi:hypothetical protein
MLPYPQQPNHTPLHHVAIRPLPTGDEKMRMAYRIIIYTSITSLISRSARKISCVPAKNTTSPSSQPVVGKVVYDYTAFKSDTSGYLKSASSSRKDIQDLRKEFPFLVSEKMSRGSDGLLFEGWEK